MSRVCSAQVERLLLAVVAVLLWVVVPTPKVLGQGCVASRQGACTIGSLARLFVEKQLIYSRTDIAV